MAQSLLHLTLLPTAQSRITSMFLGFHRDYAALVDDELTASLSLKPHPEASCTFTKCVLAALKDIADCFANIGVFKATSYICNRRQPSRRMRACDYIYSWWP